MRWSLPVLCCVCACEPDERVFVGSVDGTDAEVGVVLGDGRATAYVCGGDETRSTLTRWFAGSAEVEAGSLAADGWALAWDGAAGTLTDPSGVQSTWALEDQTGTAGVYDADDSGCRDGAVVWEADGETVLLGTWGCYEGESPAFSEVTPVGTVRLDRELTVRALTPDGEREFVLARVNAW